jgi:hypothetical protein
MKNEDAFLKMESIILGVAANMRYGIHDVHDRGITDPLELAKTWIGDHISERMVDLDVQDYVFYLHEVQDSTVLVIGVQEEAKPNENPDDLFYCEVVRVSTKSLLAYVEKGEPASRFFTGPELEALWKHHLLKNSDWADFATTLNKKLQASII